MTKLRLASPPPEIEEEADLLLDEWAVSDTPLPFHEFLLQNASDKVKEYMESIADLHDEEE